MLMWTMHFHSQSQRVVEDIGSIKLNWNLLEFGSSLCGFWSGFGNWELHILTLCNSCNFWIHRSVLLLEVINVINISNLKGWQSSRLKLSAKLAKIKNFPDPFIVWVMSWRLYYSTIYIWVLWIFWLWLDSLRDVDGDVDNALCMSLANAWFLRHKLSGSLKRES